MILSETEKEMLQSEAVCKNFDFNLTKKLAEKIGTKRIIFTGMGSSLIFPAKQAKNHALKFNLINKVEAYFASDLFQYHDFSNTFIFLCSNSGKTKEVILLLEHLKKNGGTSIAITTVKDSLLAQRCEESIILSSGFEKGVAATKSVIEQGLVYDSLIFNLAQQQGHQVNFEALKKDLIETGRKITANINLKLAEATVIKLASFKHYFFVGLDNGVAEEIALKSYEITRKIGLFYPDTHLVHGVEEAITGDAAIIFDPLAFQPYLSDFEKMSKKTNCLLLGVGSLIPGLNLQLNENFKNYCFLSGGWALLRNIANHLDLDIDHPEKASKVGNPFEAGA